MGGEAPIQLQQGQQGGRLLGGGRGLAIEQRRHPHLIALEALTKLGEAQAQPLLGGKQAGGERRNGHGAAAGEGQTLWSPQGAAGVGCYGIRVVGGAGLFRNYNIDPLS